MKKIFKYIMVFWCLFIGIGAVAGSIGMFVAPDGSALGMQEMLPYFQVLPFADVLFQNYIFAGISLLIVNGLTNLVASCLIICNKKIGTYLGCIFGFTLMLWITIQFIIFPMNFMSTIYFIFGLLQFLCGYYYIILFKQSEFSFDKDNYTNIGRNHNSIVVFFSRRGYTKKLAYKKANDLQCDIVELTTNERTKGFLGFAWLGRFAMHKWGMDINKIDVDFEKYDKVIIVTPIYDFAICPPIRKFCQQYSGKLKNVEYTLVHFRKDSTFSSGFDEMDKLLGVVGTNKESIVCKFGKVVKVKSFDR